MPQRKRVTFAPTPILRTRTPPSPSHYTLPTVSTESRRDRTKRLNSLEELEGLRSYILEACNLASESAKLAVQVLSFESLCALISYIDALRDVPANDRQKEQERLRKTFHSKTKQNHPHELLAPPERKYALVQERNARMAQVKRKRRIAEYHLDAFVAKVLNKSVEQIRAASGTTHEQYVIDAFRTRTQKYNKPSSSNKGSSVPNSPISSFSHPRSPRTDPMTYYVPPISHRDYVEELNIPMADLRLPTASFDFSNFDHAPAASSSTAPPNPGPTIRPPVNAAQLTPQQPYAPKYPMQTTPISMYHQTPPQPPLPSQPSLPSQPPLPSQPQHPMPQPQPPTVGNYSSAHNTPTQTTLPSPYVSTPPTQVAMSFNGTPVQQPTQVYVLTPTQTPMSGYTGTPTQTTLPVVHTGTPTQATMTASYGGTPNQTVHYVPTSQPQQAAFAGASAQPTANQPKMYATTAQVQQVPYTGTPTQPTVLGPYAGTPTQHLNR